MPDNIYLNELEGVAKDDVDALRLAEKSYGNSWKKRGGIGAFMMIARKWDRLENSMTTKNCSAVFSQYDIFEAIANDKRAEGLIDTVRDLRRYLMLVEAELRASGRCPGKLAKDIEEGCASKGGTLKVYIGALINAPPIGNTDFPVTVDGTIFMLDGRIGMQLVKYVKEKLGESVLSEVKLDNHIPIGQPIPTTALYIAFIRGIAAKVAQAYSIGHLKLLLSDFVEAEVDDTPPASVLHPG